MQLQLVEGLRSQERSEERSPLAEAVGMSRTASVEVAHNLAPGAQNLWVHGFGQGSQCEVVDTWGAVGRREALYRPEQVEYNSPVAAVYK